MAAWNEGVTAELCDGYLKMNCATEKTCLDMIRRYFQHVHFIPIVGVGKRLERNHVSKHQIQPEYRDEQADAGRDCQTRLARPNYKARTKTGKYSFSVFQLTTSRIGNLTRLIHTLAICVTIHETVDPMLL